MGIHFSIFLLSVNAHSQLKDEKRKKTDYFLNELNKTIIKHDNKRSMELLIKYSTLLNSKNTDGNTPFQFVLSKGFSKEIIDHFVTAPGFKINLKNKKGETALIWVLKDKVWITKKISIEEKKIKIKALKYVLEKLLNHKKINVKLKDNLKLTPLHYAVVNRVGVDIIKNLIALGAQTDAKDIKNRTPKFLAEINNYSEVYPLLEEKTKSTS